MNAHINLLYLEDFKFSCGSSGSLFFFCPCRVRGNPDYLLLFMVCSNMDSLHACARDGDVEGLAKLLDQGSLINVKGTFSLISCIFVM